LFFRAAGAWLWRRLSRLSPVAVASRRLRVFSAIAWATGGKVLAMLRRLSLSPGLPCSGRWAIGVLVLAGIAGMDIRRAAAQERATGEGASEQAAVASARDRDFSHPYGAVEFGIGVLALPDAEVCGGPSVGCDRGDVSLEVDAWPLFRPSPWFAVGAGMTLALTPTQDVPQRATMFPRDHSRRYFLVEGIGRYYFAYGRDLEVWAGLSTGLVVVSDNFRTNAALPVGMLIGSDSANIATEGFTLGLAAGATFGVSDVLQIGGTLRVGNWFLPSNPEVIAFEEEGSLSGRVTMINLALTVAYHGR
jgi:hypothetical protein